VSAGLVVVAAGLRALFAFLSQVGLALAGSRVLAEVRLMLFAHLQRLSLRYHGQARTGDLITRLTGDVNRLQEVTVTAALPLAANVLTLVGMVVVMAVLDPLLALVALAVFPLASPALLRRGGRIRAVSRRQRAREGELASSAAEALGAIRVVQALSLERRAEAEFEQRNAASLQEGVRAKRLAAGLERRVDVLVGIGTGLVLYAGALRVRAGAITPGDLVVFMLYLKAAFKPMRDLAKYTGRLARAAASGERVLELLDTEPDVRDRPGARPAGRVRGEVELRGVALRYADDARPALDGLDLAVPAGATCALVGPSGAGKSSVLGLVPRLWDPDAGQVLVDGTDVRELTLASLRAQVAVVPQESVLFAASVRDNIAMGAPGADDLQVVEAARLAGAVDFVRALPGGFGTVLGERGASLSGGQRQRLAVARAAVRDAPIVLLDEPTTGLDEHNERLVTDALLRLCEGRTTLWVTHDLAVAARADLVAYVDEGRVLEAGPHEELLRRGGRYAAMWALQQVPGQEARA
jgi:ATP-binding cassette, subfamily B, bacterial